jgi:DNA-binding transcriptional LysR family regulator
MNAVESKALRYYVAVAEELSFSRAAERLSVAAPVLSRAVSQLEAQIGVRLLERTTRSVRMTEAGRALLEEARPALQAVDAAVVRARRVAATQGRLVLAYKPDLCGELLKQARQAYEEQEDGATPLDVLLCGWNDEFPLLRDGEADVAVLYQPHERVDEALVDFEVLFEEAECVALPASHPLAAHTVLRLDDLRRGYEPVPGTSVWRPRGRGTAAPAGPSVRDMSHLLTLVEDEQVIAQLPASIATRFARPQIAYRPLIDAPPVVCAVAWSRASRSRATAAFVRIITAIAENQTDPTTGTLMLPSV